MQNAVEILKIVDGALNGDRNKVVSYTRQLADKLDEGGDKAVADRLRRALDSSRLKDLHLAGIGSAPIPADSESRVPLADRTVISDGSIELFLDTELRIEIERFISYVQKSDLLINAGVGISPTLLLHGPPGCGKTETAKYISSQLGLPLLTARADSLISSFLGSTSKNIRALFTHASSRPCILFLDELDVFAKLRDDSHELGELKRVVVSILQNIDALESSTVLIAATNHAHLLDSAVWRRFSFRLEISKPDLTGRTRLFMRFLGKICDRATAEVFAALSDGLSGSDIKEVCEYQRRAMIVDDLVTLDVSDFNNRLLRLTATSCSPDRAEIIRRVRNSNPKTFTYRRLAKLFGISIGQVSNLLRAS